MKYLKCIVIIMALIIPAMASISIQHEVTVKGHGNVAHPTYEFRTHLYDIFSSGRMTDGIVYHRETGEMTEDIDSLESTYEAVGDNGTYSMSAKTSTAAHSIRFTKLNAINAQGKISVTPGIMDTSNEIEVSGIGSTKILGYDDYGRPMSIREDLYNGTARLLSGVHVIVDTPNIAEETWVPIENYNTSEEINISEEENNTLITEENNTLITEENMTLINNTMENETIDEEDMIISAEEIFEGLYV